MTLSLFDPRVQLAIQARQAREQLLAGNPLPIVQLHWPGAMLDDFQVDIIASAFNPAIQELFIKGCTGAGKGCAVAIAVNLWFLIREGARIIVTAPNYDHARTVMFGEISAWRKQMRYPGAGRLLATGMAAEGKSLELANPETSEGFSGRHGPNTLFVFDEATATSDEFYDLAKTQSRLIIALANPRALSGWFRRAFPRHDPNRTQTIECPLGQRRCITISGQDCRNVKEGRTVIPNQLTRERFQAIMAHEDPQHGLVFGLAEFPTEDPERQVILPSWLERHTGASGENLPVSAFGLDVAASRFGDLTVLAAGGSTGVRALHIQKLSDTMETVGWVLNVATKVYGIDLCRGRIGITVDATGIGKGVADRLKERGARVDPFVGAASPDNGDLYQNRRAEAYGELARRLDPRGAWSDQTWRLPADPLLLEELVAVEKIFGSEGLKFRLIPKERTGNESYRGDTIKEKLGRSPDRADAVVLLYDQIRRNSRRRKRAPRITRPLLLGSSGRSPEPFPLREWWRN